MRRNISKSVLGRGGSAEIVKEDSEMVVGFGGHTSADCFTHKQPLDHTVS